MRIRPPKAAKLTTKHKATVESDGFREVKASNIVLRIFYKQTGSVDPRSLASWQRTIYDTKGDARREVISYAE